MNVDFFHLVQHLCPGAVQLPFVALRFVPCLVVSGDAQRLKGWAKVGRTRQMRQVRSAEGGHGHHGHGCDPRAIHWIHGQI